MKLLSHEQSTVLQGNLRRLSLPADTYLYVSMGIPQLFQLETDQEELSFDDSWVYVPQEELDSFRQQLLVHASGSGHSCLALHPVETEDGNLFPVLINGQVRAVVVDRSRQHTRFDTEVLLMLREAFVAFDASQQARGHNPLLELVSGLIGSDMQVDDYYYRIFQSLTHYSDRLLSAVYAEHDGVYYRGLVAGDIGLYENLPREVPQEMARSWIDGIRRHRNFQPPQLSPAHTCFLDAPLNFLFIHRGISEEGVDQLVATAMPGDCDRRLACLLVESARLTESLDARQFGLGLELESIQRDLRRQRGREVFVRAATRVMQRLRRVLPLRRLVLHDNTNGSSVVMRLMASNDWVVSERHGQGLPHEITRQITERGVAFVDRVDVSGYDERYLRQCQDDDVSSEAFYPGITEDSALFAFGCETAGMQLRANRRLLFRAAQVLNSALAISRRQASVDENAVVPDSANVDRYRCGRLGTISRLANGYFHDIVDYLSVVMGQISLAESGVMSRPTGGTDAIKQGLEKVREAMDSITDYLKRLRSLTTMEYPDFQRTMSLAGFLQDLNWMLHGFARQIRDTRNITLRITPELVSAGQTRLSVGTVFDVLLPVVMLLMDEAVCSGSLILRVHEPGSQEQLDIVFDPAILAHRSVEQFVQQVFPDASTGISGNRLEFDEATLLFSQETASEACITLTGRGQLQDNSRLRGAVLTSVEKGQDKV